MKTSIIFVTIWALVRAVPGPGVYQLTDPVDHSESPTWDTRNNILYFVNIHEGEIYKYDYETGQIDSIKLDGEVAPAIPSKADPNLLIAGLNRSVVAVEWNSESPATDRRILTTVSTEFPTSRFNDGKADKEGRLWIGTMGYEGPNGLTPDEGVFYEMTCDNFDPPLIKIAPVNISNGLAWNKANDKLYYIDTPTGQVVEYSYNNEKGEISDRRVAFDMNDHIGVITGSPDGMTIDEDDNLWVALYGGGAVIKVDSSSGDLLQVVAVPAEDVTSAMWGGPDLDVLFVTTSRYSLTEEEKQQQPAAGAVFAVIGLDTKGLPMYDVDLVKSINDQDCGSDKL
jgi:gluconolactonase